jgi:outer membrane usher protein FimD/PapC
MWIPRAARDKLESAGRQIPRAPGALLAALILAAVLPAAAQTPAPRNVVAAKAPQDDELIVTVRVNGVDRGDLTLLRKPDGDFWLPAGELAALKVDPQEQAQREAGGQGYYSLRALGARVVFDEARLALQVDFPPKGLARTEIDLANRPPPVPLTRPGHSLILSYRLAGTRASGGATQVAMDTDLNVRLGPILLRQESRMVFSGAAGSRRFSRGSTQALWDDPRNGRRVIVGDVVSSAGAYGTSITAGGILVTKDYDMLPDVIKQPTASLQTSSALPAQVEVAVDGSTIYRTNVGPGPISLNNLLLYGGTRNVRVTVTDASGRREVLEQPFLFTDSVLAKGLHDYSYFLGKRSELGADNAWHYRELAWQGFHRYGVNDHLTVAAGGEGNRDFTNAGAGITLRSDTLGLLSLDLLGSRNRAGTIAPGWSARYTYATPLGSLVLGKRHFSSGFRSFLGGTLVPSLRDENRIGIATQLGQFSLALDLARSTDDLATHDTGSLRMATSIGRRTTLSAELQARRDNGVRDWGAFIFLRRELDGDRWVGSSVHASSGRPQFELDAGKQLNQGEGVGYRLGLATGGQGGAGGVDTSLSANWNLRPVTLEFIGSSPLHGAGGRFAEVAASGALVAVDNYWGLTRKVDDGFVLARLGVPQKGVDVLVNNQVQGTTDANGDLFIPQVTSFGRQDVAVNGKQLGMQFSLPQQRHTISTAYRSGTIVDFGAKQVHAVAGMAWKLVDGRRAPVVSRAWTLKGAGGTLAIETGLAGDFYLEDAAPGQYRGELDEGSHQLACRFEMPQSAEPVVESKEGVICE